MCSWQSNNRMWLWGKLLWPHSAQVLFMKLKRSASFSSPTLACCKKLARKNGSWMLGFASYFLVSGGSSLFARLHSVIRLSQKVLNRIPETKEWRVISIRLPCGTEEEMQRLHRIQFKFMPDRQPFSLAASIAANLQVHLARLGGFMPDRFGHGFDLEVCSSNQLWINCGLHKIKPLELSVATSGSSFWKFAHSQTCIVLQPILAPPVSRFHVCFSYAWCFFCRPIGFMLS